MKRYKQFSELKVHDFETEFWEHPLHNHNHFEIIFIAKGYGVHHLNKRLVPYKAGHLYLLGPEDEHEFIVYEKTRFIYFKFTNFYLDTKDVDNPSNWNRDVDIILNNKARTSGNILKFEKDKTLVENILNLIVREYERNEILSKKIIFQFFKGLVLIIKRNLLQDSKLKSELRKITNTTEELLEYIEVNIYNPKLLTQKQIANHFNLSPNYIGIYFKEKVGTALKQYIQEYRFELLEQRLKNGQVSTKQLALDFGFTDESHLHKFVKSYSGKRLAELKHEFSTVS
ncbi:AraC family transcriptional regulator [Winogradskyella sp. SYSU M77433]|uniref:AraC family transcriptional regulator n=1 Tax=Winogradskyella sp. SYSU M77433 TaxID=3042722 RepID=UPI0024807C08|nr:AraC family transcriptional regulator [Winogradskyella sp. SYSU M77433]MDH7911305.1 AraC family transcriptional regulator [Winogradskyella sp. SYSU M77433]